MSTTDLRQPAPDQPTVRPTAAPAAAARITFRQPVSSAGYIDAAWWPRSLDLSAELPVLMDALWDADRNINRVTYNLAAWAPAPRRLMIEGRTVRLGGFSTGDPLVVRLADAWGKDSIDVVVIAPDTEAGVAQRALRIAGTADSPYRAGEILARAAGDNNDKQDGATP